MIISSAFKRKKRIHMFRCWVIGICFSIIATSTCFASDINIHTSNGDSINLYEHEDKYSEEMDSFIKEYEQGLRFRDNAIDNSSVDRMTLSKEYGEELVSSADRQILMVNKAAKERKVIIEDSGLLYQTDRVPLSKASKKLNVTKTESYWWGRINYLSYSNADKLRKDSIKFKTATQVISEIAGIASFVKPNPPLGGFSLGNLAISHYCSYFAKRIKACNKKGKGIKYKIYWTMNYKMRTQGQSW